MRVRELIRDELIRRVLLAVSAQVGVEASWRARIRWRSSLTTLRRCGVSPDCAQGAADVLDPTGVGANIPTGLECPRDGVSAVKEPMQIAVFSPGVVDGIHCPIPSCRRRHRGARLQEVLEPLGVQRRPPSQRRAATRAKHELRVSVTRGQEPHDRFVRPAHRASGAPYHALKRIVGCLRRGSAGVPEEAVRNRSSLPNDVDRLPCGRSGSGLSIRRCSAYPVQPALHSGLTRREACGRLLVGHPATLPGPLRGPTAASLGQTKPPRPRPGSSHCKGTRNAPRAGLTATEGYGHTPGMATTTVKSTYSLDVESVRALEELARRQQVSKSEALRRAIRNEARRQPAKGEDAVAALEQLQASLHARDVDLEQWARDVESGRRRAMIVDCMIGAAALADDAPVATSNRGDFSRFAAAGLKLA